MNRLASVNDSERRGFSLLELLLAMSISSLLLLLMASLLSTSLNQWQRNSSFFQKNSEGTSALDLITCDLQSIVPKSDGSEWLQVFPEPVKDLDAIPWLMFLATAREQGSDSDRGTGVCAISYRLARQTLPGSEDAIYALYRTVLSPEETIEHLGAEDLKTSLWDKSGIPTTGVDSIIASYIIDFDLSFLIETLAGEKKQISPQELRLGKDAPEIPEMPAGSVVRGMEVRFTALDREGQNRLNDGGMALDAIRKERGEDFRAFIEFPLPLF